ncbi:MAG: cytochrome c3 family protein, partial [Gammaproteobacteria bacterium]|nr:cytochrome c3 family protein [Gammaproteobacteria bacterium]
MDPTEEVELINNSVPKNYKTNITDNSTSILLVTSPQVLGHGNAECSECHGHSNSELTFVGDSESDCMGCHEDNLTRTKLLKFEDPKSNNTEKISQEDNVWTVIPPQVAGHGNVTCLECHDHAPSDFTNSSGFLGPDCFTCHDDPLRNVTLINDTIPKKSKTTVVDNTSNHWLVTAPQVTTHGNDTNSDGAVNSTDCAVCHGHTNSNLVYVSNCHDCHSEPDSHPVQGSGYSSMIPDECLDCHGTIHAITLGGGPDCMSSLCHATNSKPVNMSLFNNSVHKNLNSGAANTTPISYEYTEACWL